MSTLLVISHVRVSYFSLSFLKLLVCRRPFLSLSLSLILLLYCEECSKSDLPVSISTPRGYTENFFLSLLLLCISLRPSFSSIYTFRLYLLLSLSLSVWPDWAIYYTLGNFSKLVAPLFCSNRPDFWEIFVKAVKMFHFQKWNHFGQHIDIWRLFYWSCWSLSPFLLSFLFNILSPSLFLSYFSSCTYIPLSLACQSVGLEQQILVSGEVFKS